MPALYSTVKGLGMYNGTTSKLYTIYAETVFIALFRSPFLLCQKKM